MRSTSPAGAADSEYGCACHHSPRRRKRHWKNWPPATGSRSSRRPRSTIETTPGPSGVTPTTRTWWRSERHTGSPTRAATTTPSVPSHSAVHQSARDGMPDERRARVDLVREGQEQREVGVEVHRPPRLVGHAPAREPVGGDAGGEQEDRADGRGQDARVGPQQLPELVQHAVVRLPGVADRDQHGVGEQQVQRPRARACGARRRAGPGRSRAPAAARARRAARRRPSRRRRAARSRRPSAVAIPPGALSDPALSAVTARPIVTPSPIPAAAASTSTTSGPLSRGTAPRRARRRRARRPAPAGPARAVAAAQERRRGSWRTARRKVVVMSASLGGGSRNHLRGS